MNLHRVLLTGTISLALAAAAQAQPRAVRSARPAARVAVAAAEVDATGGLPGPGGVRLPGPPEPPTVVPRVLSRRDLSWIHIDRPRPRKVGVHDIVTVIVDEKSEVLQNSRFNRQRNGVFKAELKDFIRLSDSFTLENAAANSPAIDAQLRSQLQSFAQGMSQEGMKYRIAATVVDVLPNGTLVLEARKSIRTNSELWEYSLTGRIRTQDIGANNTITSENVAELRIVKREHGKIYDGTKRGIFLTLYDWLLPF